MKDVGSNHDADPEIRGQVGDAKRLEDLAREGSTDEQESKARDELDSFVRFGHVAKARPHHARHQQEAEQLHDTRAEAERACVPRAHAPSGMSSSMDGGAGEISAASGSVGSDCTSGGGSVFSTS